VSRIILAVFRNLIEKPEEVEVRKENCISMYQCKVLKQLELLEQRKFEDEDIQEDIEFLMEKLEASVQVRDVGTFNWRTSWRSWRPVFR
jgi:V-type H+-transporting ATPase subunit H